MSDPYADLAGQDDATQQRIADAMEARCLEPAQQAVAKNIFLRLTELGQGSEDTRRRVQREELRGAGQDEEAVNAVLQVLTDEKVRLLTMDRDEVEVSTRR